MSRAVENLPPVVRFKHNFGSRTQADVKHPPDIGFVRNGCDRVAVLPFGQGNQSVFALMRPVGTIFRQQFLVFGFSPVHCQRDHPCRLSAPEYRRSENRCGAARFPPDQLCPGENRLCAVGVKLSAAVVFAVSENDDSFHDVELLGKNCGKDNTKKMPKQVFALKKLCRGYNCPLKRKKLWNCPFFYALARFSPELFI